MNFKKDLLIIDTEFSGFDLKKHDILQIAGILLDKKTLKEKKSFNSFIRPIHWKTRDPAAMAVNKITWEQVKDAPLLADAIKAFNQTFDTDVMLTSYVGFTDKKYLMDAYQKAGVQWLFDYHYFDIWSVCYAHLGGNNELASRKDFAGFGIESMMERYKLEAPPLHDALVDCRVEAEILRRVVAEQTGKK